MAGLELPDNLLAGLIPGLGGRVPGRRSEKKKETVKTSSFRTSLKEAAAYSETEPSDLGPFSAVEAEELLDMVHSAGEELKTDPNPERVKTYKRAVRDFVHYVVSRAYDIDKKTSGRNILKRKDFTTVVIIDEKLERLAAEVLSAQRDKLEILRRLDEIHGLLVDLLT